MIFASILCLLVAQHLFEHGQASSVLSPDKRQKKSFQEDADYIGRGHPYRSPFRERQTDFTNKRFSKKNREPSLPSLFSERRHLLDNQEQRRHLSVDDLDGYGSRPLIPPFVGQKQDYSNQKRESDPWFPAQEIRKRYQVDPEREAIDAALKHMAWERLNKRLVRLQDTAGSYLDRGERRSYLDRGEQRPYLDRGEQRPYLDRGEQRPYLDRGDQRLRVAKRAPKPFDEKQLEAILSDDATNETGANDSVDETTDSGNKSSIRAMIRTGSGSQDRHRTLFNSHQTLSSVSPLNKVGGSSEQVVNKKGTKGRQWMPLDSEPTLRSKKSWDDYFGLDKRESHPQSNRWQVLNDDNDDDDNNSEDDNEEDVGEGELKDYLARLYFDKMLNKMMPQSDTVGMEDARENKMKKKKRLGVLLDRADLSTNGRPDEDQDQDDDQEAEEDWSSARDLNAIIPFEQVDERLQKIEDDILFEATQLLERDAQSSRDDNVDAIEQDVVNHLKAAFNVEKMRDALEDFQDFFRGIKSSERSETGTDIREESDDDDKRKKNKKKRNQSEDNEDDDDDKKKKRNESEEDEDEHRMKKNGGGEQKKTVFSTGKSSVQGISSPNNVGASTKDLSNEIATPLITNGYHDEQDVPCPVITNSLGYCEELSDAVGEMGQLLARPCVKHMLCYTCDNIPAVCDSVFLQEAEIICQDDFRCQAIAGAMRSVFLSNHHEFRHHNHRLCNVDQCLLRLLSRK